MTFPDHLNVWSGKINRRRINKMTKKKIARKIATYAMAASMIGDLFLDQV